MLTYSTRGELRLASERKQALKVLLVLCIVVIPTSIATALTMFQPNSRGQGDQQNGDNGLMAFYDTYPSYLVQVADGGYLIAGSLCQGWTSTSSVSHASPAYEDYNQGYLMKVAANGSVQWIRTFKHGVYSVLESCDGGLVIATSCIGGVEVMKLDSVGDLEWNRTYAIGQSSGEITLSYGADGGLIITANTISGGNWSLALVKLDPQWNIKWLSIIPERETMNTRLQPTSDGGYLLTGRLYTDDFAGFIMLKTDANGTLQWEKKIPQSSICLPSRILMLAQQTQDGGYMLAGMMNSDFWLVKTDEYANTIWNKTHGEPLTEDVLCCAQQTNDNGYILAGYAYPKDDFPSNVHILLVKLDEQGEPQWNKTYQTAQYNKMPYAGINCLRQTSDGGCVLFVDHSMWQNANWLIKTTVEGSVQWQTNISLPRWEKP